MDAATNALLTDGDTALSLLQELLFANARRNSLAMIWQDNIGLLARRVTENASRSGEHQQ